MGKEVLEVIMLLEKAVQKVNELRRKVDSDNPELDARSLSIAVTHIETGQLWVANARR